MSIILKPCASHFEDLNTALRHKGVAHLINQDPARAAACAKEWLTKESCPPDLFDPLAVAYVEINKNATLVLGMRYIHGRNGVECPLCALNKHLKNPGAAAIWVDNITTLMMLTAEKFHLKPRGV